MEPTTLTTERLTLRPWRLTDAEDVFAYAQDTEWGRFLPLPQPYERHHADEFVARSFLADWETRPEFAIVHEGTVSGGISMRIATEHSVGELGYSIAQPLWGRGLVAEAGAAILAWAFDAYDLVRTWARADVRNTASQRVMEKLGMQREALLRSHAFWNGERRDEVWYGILREEWKSRQE